MLRVFLVALLITSVASADPIADLSSASNRFAFALFHELAKSDSDNIVISPYSLDAALCMTYAGARGETAEQMDSVLQIDSLGKTVHAAQRDLINNLRITCNSDTVARLSIANALWSAGCTAKPDFTKLLRDRYDAESRQLSIDPIQAADAINRWADEHTEHKVPKVVDSSDLAGELAVVITNAVYFLGRWQHPFQAANTEARSFWLNPRDSVQVPMMHEDRPRSDFKVLQTDEFQAIQLPYNGSTAVMDVFLPRRRDGLAKFEDQLSARWLDDQVAQYPSALATVDLLLPKVKSEGNWHLAQALSAMGMSMAFDGSKADFSGICPGIWIDDVIHGTFLEIDERGTEAAAVTVVVMLKSGAPDMIEFHADHPFFFVIRDTATNTILFMGHIVDPRG